MTIEVANRLVDFRKKFGYSQEELANQLNVSRQSISNWESGEVTPSIDYLKALAKIYGVTMDELVSCDKSVDEVLKAHGTKDAKSEDSKASENKSDAKDDKATRNNDQVHIGKDGIHVHSKDGDNVDIDISGIHVNDESISDMVSNSFDWHNQKKFKNLSKYQKRKRLANKVEGLSSGIMFLLVTIAYMLLGFFVKDGWKIYWTLYLLIPVLGGLISTFILGKVSRFPIVMIVCFVYLFGGAYANLWHPFWVEFLVIPVFYMIATPIDKAIIGYRLDKEDDDSVITINGEDLKVHQSAGDTLNKTNENVLHLESRIESFAQSLAKAKSDPKTYQEVKDDFETECDDLKDEIDDFEDTIDDLNDENLLTFDQKIELRSKARKMKERLAQIKSQL